MDTNIDSDLIRFLHYKLHLSETARVLHERFERRVDPIFKPDLLIEDHGSIFFIIMRRKFSYGDIAKLQFLNDFNNKRQGEILNYLGLESRYDVIIVGLTVYFGSDIAEYVLTDGLNVITIPAELYTNLHPPHRSPLPKLSSESSFKVILSLLKLKSASILEISKHSGVSYPWTHGVVLRLMQIGGVSRHTGFVSISNMDTILDAISYERPFVSLIYREISVEMDDALELGTLITSMSNELKIHPVFTYLTAAAIRDRINIKRDIAYAYITKAESTALSDILPVSKKGKIKLALLLPDREILKDSEELKGIRIASEEQTILDLISGGIPYRDVAKRTIERYVS